MPLRVRHLARNVLFNWFGTIANMAVGFFLSPFILHRLGNLTFGVWVLSVSAVAYMNLLDVGMQNSVLRFVSKGYTQNDHEGASEVFSAALWIRLQISLLVLLLSVGLAFAFPLLFKIPPELAGDARKAVVLIGASTAVSLLMGVFGGVLAALHRYDLRTSASLLQTLIRATGVVVLLRGGHGIVAIAVCEFAAVLTSNLLVVGIARRLYPALRIQFKVPGKDVLRKIYTYSVYVFLTAVAVQVIYQTDNLVVGAFVTTSAVTFYAIANSLCRYATQMTASIAQTFMPAASSYEAAGDTAGLLLLYTNGTRALLVVALPIMLTLILRGGSFIGLWMGPQYSKSSGMVLAILGIALLIGFANQTAGSIALGVEKHKPVALVAMAEGVLNLTLSIVLARKYGLYGVAFGTFIPSVLTHLIFWPLYISRLVGLSQLDVFLRIWGPLYLAAVPFALASYCLDRFFPAHSLAGFFLQVVATLPTFFVVLALIFRSFVSSQVMPRLRSLRAGAVA